MTPKPETTPEPEVEPTPEPELLTTQQTFGLYAGFIALLFILCVILLVLYLKQRKRYKMLPSHPDFLQPAHKGCWEWELLPTILLD